MHKEPDENELSERFKNFNLAREIAETSMDTLLRDIFPDGVATVPLDEPAELATDYKNKLYSAFKLLEESAYLLLREGRGDSELYLAINEASNVIVQAINLLRQSKE